MQAKFWYRVKRFPSHCARWLYRFRWLVVGAIAILGLLTYFVGIPEYAEWECERAENALHSEDYISARRHIFNAIRWNKNESNYHRFAGKLDRLTGNYSSAEEHLNECIKLERKTGISEDTQLEWLLLRAERGEIDEVVPVLRELTLQKHPQSEQILQVVARIYMREVRLPKALECLNYWAISYPDSVKAIDWRGWVFERLGQKDQAIREYQRLLELDPSQHNARQRLVALLLEGQRTADVQKHLDLLSQNDPKNLLYRTMRANLLLLQGSEPDAIRAILSGVLEENPNSASALFLYGKLELQEQHYQQAETYLRQALRRDPNDLEYLYNLIVVLQKQPSPEHTSEAAQLMALREEKSEAFARMATLLNTIQDGSEKDSDKILELAKLLLRFHHDELGIYWLQRLLKINPKSDAALQIIEEYYRNHGQPEKAAEIQRRRRG